jgi:CDK5 regulatory subunit-associated protein 2
MKDYEEQLSSLRKENFNLKLNVYFLEERLYSSSHTPASQDNLSKKNIELKVFVFIFIMEMRDFILICIVLGDVGRYTT